MDVSTFTSHRRVLRTDSGDMAYTEWGTGPAAVFVHGVATSGVLWRHVIEQVDLVGNDTGGAIAQIVAARHPGLLRSLVLTNCDTEGNFPPPQFAPVVEAARQGALADFLVSLAADPAAARASALAGGYEHPDKIPDEVWLEYGTAAVGTIDRARNFERILAALVPGQMAGVNDKLRGLNVPTLLVWGTSTDGFGMEWAYGLRDLILGAREVIEVDGGKLFFPEERSEELAAPLRQHWGR